MTDDDTAETEDRGGIGAEGEANRDTLPAMPNGDDDSPLGDTDQHSQVSDSGHDKMRR